MPHINDNPKWSEGDIYDLTTALSCEVSDDGGLDSVIATIAERQGRTPGSVRAKAIYLGLVDGISAKTYGNGVRTSNEDRDLEFQSAMHRAIAAGLESPPVGIDTRPGTRRPKLIDPRHSRGAVFASSSAFD